MGIAFKKFKLRQVSEKLSADDFTETVIPEAWIAEEFPVIPAIILRPTIDKLVVRYNLQGIKNKTGAKGAILEKLNSLSSSSKYPEYKAVPKDKKGFYNNFELTPPDANSSVLIQLNPVKKSNHFMRLTFNPTKLTKQGVAFLISEIEKFSDGHIKYDILAKTKNTIADIHIAVDILGIALEDMEVRYYKDSKSKLFTSDTGRKQSQYLNFTKDTKSIAYVYDKRRELIDNQQKPKYKNALHVRVERRINVSKSKKSINDLANLNNPFKKVSIRAANYSALKCNADFTHTLFIQNALIRTLEKTLRLLPEGKKQEYEAAFNQAILPIWNPEHLWSYWPQSFKSSGLISTKED